MNSIPPSNDTKSQLPGEEAIHSYKPLLCHFLLVAIVKTNQYGETRTHLSLLFTCKSCPCHSPMFRDNQVAIALYVPLPGNQHHSQETAPSNVICLLWVNWCHYRLWLKWVYSACWSAWQYVQGCLRSQSKALIDLFPLRTWMYFHRLYLPLRV